MSYLIFVYSIYIATITSNDIQASKASEYQCQRILLAMPVNTAMPMFRTGCQTEITYTNMAESKLHWLVEE